MKGALTDAETEQLAARLADNESRDGLSFEGVDGLFCALIASPALVMPSAYLPLILGAESDDGVVFETAEEANAIVSLLMRHWNAIVSDFESDDHIHMPYIEEPGIDNIPGRAWARGFLQGTRLASHGWSRFFDDENEGYGITIPVVAGEVDPEWPREPLTSDKSDELLEMMIAAAARAYRYFAGDRRAIAEPNRTTARAEPKIGRNDPCPCGSGKKFKKCHGDPAQKARH